MTAVHQFVPSYVGPGAIATHTHQVRLALAEMGLRTRIFAGDWRNVPDSDVSSWEAWQPEANQPTWVLYQLSVGHPMADHLAKAATPLMVNYHNITPAAYFKAWEPLVAPQLEQGRRQLQALAPRTEMAIAVSEFNRAELVQAGYERALTVPVLVDFDELGQHQDRARSARLDSDRGTGGSRWLFVGRIAPNKAQHRLVLALAVYRRLYDPRARLWLVGGSSSHRYLTALRQLIAELSLENAVELVGAVSQPELVSYYRFADVFVCLSEHEGFGIPLLEAFWHRLPVVALDSSGVGATTGGAAVLLPAREQHRATRPDGAATPGGPSHGVVPGACQPSPALVAAAVERVLSDERLGRLLRQAGEQRVAEFGLARTRAAFQAAVATAVDNG